MNSDSSPKESTLSLQNREERKKVLDVMYAKAEEIASTIKLSGKDYSLYDLLSFSVVNFVNFASTIEDPEYKKAITKIVGLLIDGEIMMKQMRKDGILSLTTKQGNFGSVSSNSKKD